MDLERNLFIAQVISYFTAAALPLSMILLVVGLIVDVKKRKFYWSRYTLAFFVITIALIILQIRFIYSLIESF